MSFAPFDLSSCPATGALPHRPERLFVLPAPLAARVAQVCAAHGDRARDWLFDAVEDALDRDEALLGRLDAPAAGEGAS